MLDSYGYDSDDQPADEIMSCHECKHFERLTENTTMCTCWPVMPYWMEADLTCPDADPYMHVDPEARFRESGGEPFFCKTFEPKTKEDK